MSDDDDLRKLAADLTKATQTAKSMVGVAIRKGAHDIIALAQEAVPVDTGATKNSIGADLTDTGVEVSAVIGPTTSYAPYLEHGTWKMAPRPFMGPAADAVLPSVEAAILQAGGSIL